MTTNFWTEQATTITNELLSKGLTLEEIAKIGIDEIKNLLPETQELSDKVLASVLTVLKQPVP